MSKNVGISWLSEPAEHNYPAALSYLSLIYDEQTAAAYVAKLKDTSTMEFKAKDISGRPVYHCSGSAMLNVEKDKEKIKSRRKLSPLLLIRDSANEKVIVADGYHRLCAVYAYDEDAVIPCKIV